MSSSEAVQTDRAVVRRQILWLTLFTAALRIYGLNRQSIWGDEYLSIFRYAAGENLGEVWHHIWNFAVHPPLYFMVCHYWYSLGNSEFMARFPSAVFGTACVPVMYALSNRLFGRTTAVIASVVVATSPIHIWYSQEARMYSMQMLLGISACLFYVRARQEWRVSDVILYTVMCIMGLYTHMSTLLLVAGIGVFAVVDSFHDRRRALAWIAVHLLILSVYAPWVANIYRHAQRNKSISIGYSRNKSIVDLGYSFYTFSVGYSLGPTVADLHDTTASDSVRKSIIPIGLSVVLFPVLLVLGIAWGLKNNRHGTLFLITVILVPSLLGAAAALSPHMPLNPRYVLSAIIPFWILISLGLQSAVSFDRTRLAIPAFAIVIGISLFNHYFNPSYAKQDLRTATQFVNEQAQSGDAVIISSVELGGPFIYYYRRHDVPYYGYPSSTGLVNPVTLNGDMRKILSGRKRAWLVLGRTWSSDPRGLIPKYFDRRCAMFEKVRCSGVTVTGYRLQNK